MGLAALPLYVAALRRIGHEDLTMNATHLWAFAAPRTGLVSAALWPCGAYSAGTSGI